MRAKDELEEVRQKIEELQNYVCGSRFDCVHTCLILTPGKWLQTLRHLNVARWHALQELDQATQSWLDKERDKPVHIKRHRAVSMLATHCFSESSKVRLLLERLPAFGHII